MRHIIVSIFICLMLVLASACGGEANARNESDYDKTKNMVVDILQTEDGKKAIIELLSNEQVKKELVIESEVVKDSINHALASEEGAKMWNKLFEDPKFVEKFASSMEEAHKNLLKQLMNDSEYQKQMLELLQNPEIDEQMLKVMKSQQFRAYLEETIQSTIENPLFLAKINDILLKAAEKQSQGEDQQKNEQEKNGSEDKGQSEQSDESSGEGGGGG